MRDRAEDRPNPRTCHKKAQGRFPGEEQRLKKYLGQIWVIFGERLEAKAKTFCPLSASYMKQLVPGSAGRPETPRKGLGNRPEMGRKWAYFKLLSVGPGIGPG
jgi:hypothetical protein